MRFETSGTLGRVDLTPVLDLLPALRREWADLRFAPTGAVIDPLTGDARPSLSLVDGRHREAGARYAVRVAAEAPELPVEPAAGHRRKTTPENGERSHLGPPVRRGSTTTIVALTRDDDEVLGVTVSDETAHRAVDIEIRHGRLPRVDVVVRADLTALMKANGSPGWVASLLGGSGHGRAQLDLATLDRPGGTLVDATGEANRFRGSARSRVTTAVRTWNVDATLTLKARGAGRFVLLFVARPVRRRLEQASRRLFEPGFIEAVGEALRETASMTEREGGTGAFVRRALWDPSFDPRPPSVRT